ncbi:MAG: hypothetical protein Tsb0014_04880 [Pleurocapsa sp.]
MKFSKLFLNLNLLGLVVLANLTIPQAAKADLFCYPWETDCTANGKIGDDPLGVDPGVNKTYDVYLHNKHDRPIWVAIHYKYIPKKTCTNCSDIQVLRPGSDWITDGYWKVEPGRKVLVNVSTNNRYIYFHAHDDRGTTWGSEQTFKVRNQRKSFFQATMGSQIGSYTQSFR